jgi:hypothetical protein
VEDKQMTINARQINSIGINLGESDEGDFSLELDYIKAIRVDEAGHQIKHYTATTN